MPAKNAQQKSAIIKNLTGGLNVREAITDLADNDAAAASNVVYYTAGAVVRRGGWQKLFQNSPTTAPLLGIYQAVFNVAGVITRFLIITDGVKIWQTSNPYAAVVTWTDITGVATLDATQPYKFLMMTDKVILYNGVVTFYWDGITAAITAFPAGGNTLTIQDLTYTAIGINQSDTIIEYTTGGTAGAEVVTVIGQLISIKIQSGTSTANQVRAAVIASVNASALVTVAVSGVGANPQQAPVDASFVTNISVPHSRAGIVWQNFLFWGGDKNGPTRLYFSNLADPITYPTANFIDVPSPFDGDPITGLAILYGNLLVFKRQSLYILQGAPPGNLILSRTNSDVGCLDPYSVIQVDNLVYFVSDKGLYAANLFNVRQVCYKVQPRYTAAVAVSTPANPIWVANYKQRGQLFVAANCRTLYAPDQGLNDRLLVHDYFNADQNGDAAVSEFIVGFTHFTLSAAKPADATGPSLMADFDFTGGPVKPVTIMASFYDQWVYVFTDGSLLLGGPADEIAWQSEPTFPKSDWLSKFFDAGDQDMYKQVRWLWTTAQLYNNIDLRAGIAYNNSPTVTSFGDFNTYELMAPNGNVYLLGITDAGALTLELTTDRTFVTTITILDSDNVAWDVKADNTGHITVTLSSSTPTGTVILTSPGGFQYLIVILTTGVPDPELVFAVDTTPIMHDARVPVLPLIKGTSGQRQGKGFQIYFTDIGILSQFSMDIILKGRRN